MTQFDQDSEAVQHRQVSLFNGQIILNPSISKLNFFSFIAFQIVLSLILIPVALFQVPLLGSYYKLSLDELKTLTSILNLVNLILKIFLAAAFGKLCDSFGRKPMIVVGIIGLSISVLLMPHLPSVYPFYIFLAIFLDLAALSLGIAPLLADYIDYETKGRAAGAFATLGFFTAFASTYMNKNIDLNADLTSRFHLCGALTLVCGLLIAVFGLKGGLYHKETDKKAEEAKRKLALEETNNSPLIVQKEEEEIKSGFQAGLHEAKNNPWILTGYICAFIAAAHSGISGFVLITYMTYLGGGNDGTNEAYALTNIQLLVAAFASLFFGFYADKYNKFKLIVILQTCTLLHTLCLVFTPSPHHILSYLAMFWAGIAAAGFSTITTQVLSKYPSPKHRASVGAVGSIFTVLGGSIISIIGVFLSGFNPRMPFYMYLVFGMLGSFVLFSLYAKKRKVLDNL